MTQEVVTKENSKSREWVREAWDSEGDQGLCQDETGSYIRLGGQDLCSSATANIQVVVVSWGAGGVRWEDREGSEYQGETV